MGIYLNPGNQAFVESLRSEIYVDMTGLIGYTNNIFGTKQKNICISRPRRFGKSMAAEMLMAYYDRGCDSEKLFQGLDISKDRSFKDHLNQHDVIFMNMQKFLSRANTVEEMVEYLQEQIVNEIKDAYPGHVKDHQTLSVALAEVYSATKNPFVIIIDEWDCIFREYKKDVKAQTKYLDFLRDLLKDADYISLTYMTGILPIKKYGSHSALNMFDEYSMTDPGPLARYVGFTEEVVKGLCERYQMDFTEVKRWYDGYVFDGNLHIYSPKSVVDAMRRRKLNNYWTQTETYEALKIYIEMNFDGLRDAVTLMLGGGRCRVNPRKFQNDMTTFESKDDVMTLLVHLGYLAFDEEKREVFIPNMEVESEFANAIEGAGWDEVIRAIEDSEALLDATWNMEEESVAKGIDAVHMEQTSILSYNNENSLSCVISLAYYSARNYYSLIREFPGGKGFADMVFLPRKKYADKPAMVVELKWDKSAEGAVDQIRNRQYGDVWKDYKGELLLVGINYDKSSKVHQCRIEKVEK